MSYNGDNVYTEDELDLHELISLDAHSYANNS